MAERRLGQYRLVKQLAVGGMAEIYLAAIEGVAGFQKQLALKVIHPNFSADPEFVRMLVDEAKLAVQLDHPNIVKTYDLGKVGEQHYIAMEMVDGPDLFRVLRRAADADVYLTCEMAAYVAGEVAEGLDYAHHKKDRQGRPLEIVHRDVSPQNVLISHAGDVKLCDFGIARAARSNHRTATGVLKGKYYYMAPEQAWGDQASIGPRTDVFSLGIVLYEMLVGQMLYLEEDMDRLLDLVRQADIPPPSGRRPGGVPAALEEIVMRALRKRPQDRWPTAGALGQALTAWLRQSAPDFVPVRLGGFITELTEEPAAQPTTRMRGAREVTAAVAGPGMEFTDEHSLIFRMGEGSRDGAAPGYDDGASFADGGTAFDDSDEHENNDFADPAEDRTVVDSEVRRAAAAEEAMPADGPTQQRRPAPLAAGPFAADEKTTVDRKKAVIMPAGVPFSDEAPAELTPETGPRPLPGMRPGAPPPRVTADSRPSARPGGPRGPALALSATPSPLETPTNVAAVLPATPPPPARPRLDGRTPSHPHVLPPPLVGEPVVPPSGEAVTGSGSHKLPMPGARGVRPPWLVPALAVGGTVLFAVVLLLALRPSRPRVGTVEVWGFPAGAQVIVDGQELRGNPARLEAADLRVTHHVTVTHPGHAPFASDIAFEPGRTIARVDAVLADLQRKLHVDSTPPGADVVINNRLQGQTPADVELPTGDALDVEVRHPGYKVERRQLPAGSAPLTLEFQLEKTRR